MEVTCPVCGDLIPVSDADGNCSTSLTDGLVTLEWSKHTCLCCDSVVDVALRFAFDGDEDVELIERGDY